MSTHQVFLKKWTKPATGEVRVYINVDAGHTELAVLNNACLKKAGSGGLALAHRGIDRTQLGEARDRLYDYLGVSEHFRFDALIAQIDHCPADGHRGVSLAQYRQTILGLPMPPKPEGMQEAPVRAPRGSTRRRRGKHNEAVRQTQQNTPGTPVSQNQVRDSSFSFSGYGAYGGLGADERIYPKILPPPIVEALEKDLERAIEFVAKKYGLRVGMGKFLIGRPEGEPAKYAETYLSVGVIDEDILGLGDDGVGPG